MDRHWEDMHGGYGVPYDPRAAIAELEQESNSVRASSELYENLHREGDPVEASYASIPLLVATFQENPRSWWFFCLMAIVETGRHQDPNPAVPRWLRSSYFESVRLAKALALTDLKSCTDTVMLRYATAIVAIASDLNWLGKVIAHAAENELVEIAAGFEILKYLDNMVRSPSSGYILTHQGQFSYRT